MILSHSSLRVLEPHSPSRGLYNNDLLSAVVKGTLVPSSSGNTAEIKHKINTTADIILLTAEAAAKKQKH